MRHGQSKWNLENRFTGWTDIDLTKKGVFEAKEAGNLIFKNNLGIDLVYVSYLKRAIKTSEICLKQLKKESISVLSDWRLNERHYGNLQGLNKTETAKKYGEKQVLIWRRSFDIPPPEMKKNDPRHPSNDPKYNFLKSSLLPNSESLKDTVQRIKPFINEHLAPKILKNINLLVVAHGNSLRALIKIFKKISDKDILKLNIPTGVPYVIEFNNTLEVLNDYFLGNQEEIDQKTTEVENQGILSN